MAAMVVEDVAVVVKIKVLKRVLQGKNHIPLNF